MPTARSHCDALDLFTTQLPNTAHENNCEVGISHIKVTSVEVSSTMVCVPLLAVLSGSAGSTLMTFPLPLWPTMFPHADVPKQN